MAKKIIFIGGSKGGVGKSAVASGVIDTLLEQGEKVLLIDTDTSNPDVYKSHKDVVDSLTINLDTKNGWIELLTAIHGTEAVAIINTAARSNDGIKDFGAMLMSALPELQCEFMTLWVINRQRDSLELLKQYRETITGAVHVVRNLHAGKPEQFELFNGSKIKTEIEKAGGQIIDFPDLADRVADRLTNDRLAISKGATDLPFGEKIELQRWRAEVWTALGKVV